MEENDMLNQANKMIRFIPGVLGTDSRGGYDAVNKNEGPLLGLSNTRSALQALQLREQLRDAEGRLIWISGDWNLSDALTKKCKTARQGISQFLKSGVWKLTFDPMVFQSERKARSQGRSAIEQMKQLQSLIPLNFVQWNIDQEKF